jgi:acetate kinase
LDKTHNTKNEPVISKDTSQATVRVIRTNEEVMIARSVGRILALTDKEIVK